MIEQVGKLEEKYFPFLFHYYRAEVYRETVWRNRLDVTTNWAIVVTAAVLSFVFSNNLTHAVLIINYLIVLFFLYIESRRFRYYALLRERTKIMEKNILAPIFAGKENNKSINDSIVRLTQSLIRPRITMTRIESISWRLRRNYIFILPLLYIVWWYRIASFPVRATSIEMLYSNASIGFVPGYLVFTVMTLSILVVIFTAFYIPRKYGRDDLP